MVPTKAAPTRHTLLVTALSRCEDLARVRQEYTREYRHSAETKEWRALRATSFSALAGLECRGILARKPLRRLVAWSMTLESPTSELTGWRGRNRAWWKRDSFAELGVEMIVQEHRNTTARNIEVPVCVIARQ